MGGRMSRPSGTRARVRRGARPVDVNHAPATGTEPARGGARGRVQGARLRRPAQNPHPAQAMGRPRKDANAPPPDFREVMLELYLLQKYGPRLTMDQIGQALHLSR